MTTPEFDSNADSLDAALRAAFAPADTEPGRGVLATLDETIGPQTRVLLRDAAFEEELAPFVRPAGPEPDCPRPAARPYQVVGEIARGGVGVVYKSRDVDIGRDIAMKVLRPEHVRNPAMVHRFIEEAQIAGQLQHPGVLPIYELGLTAGRTPYFTMKLVRGQTLAALLAQRAAPADQLAHHLRSFQQVCQTIAYAHARGVIHRDLKPSNVMVGAFGEVQVLDWGLAKVLGSGGLADDARASAASEQIATVRSGSDAGASLVGSVMGTPAYMPPEQARGDIERLDERSDVFSLGAILCEILTGRPPYEGGRDAALRQAAAGETSVALARLERCGADVELVRIARACLAVDRDARPRDAGAVAAALTGFLESLEARARRLEVAAAEAAARAAGALRARRLTVALAVTILVATIGGAGAWAIFQERRSQRQIEQARRLSEAMQQAAGLLGEVRAAPPGRGGPVIAAISAADARLTALLAADALSETDRARAAEFRERLRRAQSDRRMIERIEDIVIVGATHSDPDSWLWMFYALKDAYADYGIDLTAMQPDEIVRRFRESDIAISLVDGFELWISTAFQLAGPYGVELYSLPQLLEFVELIYRADPDPFRSELRRLIYTGRPDLTKLRTLRESAEFDRLSPRTLSWLATAFAMSRDFSESEEIFRCAILVHPDDVMLNVDYAYVLGPAGRAHIAIRFLSRAVALRPRTGGLWRAYGNALAAASEHRDAIDALRRSIELQPDHVHTHLDLGRALLKSDDPAAALVAFEQACRLQPDLAAAHADRGRALDRLGRVAEARAAFLRSFDCGIREPIWREPARLWAAICE